MHSFQLKIYKIRVVIVTNESFAYKHLKKDFAFYLEEDEGPALNEIRINIAKGEAPYDKVPPLEATLYNVGAICYKMKDTHYVDYGGKGLLIYDFSKETAFIYSPDENLLYEKARLTILSRVGELMDTQGIHRIHALGLSKDGFASLCILPMEGGKTTLGIGALLRDSRIKLLSDDVCFLDSKGNIDPFILRVGLRDKALINAIPEKYIEKLHRARYGEKYMLDIDFVKDHISEKSKVRNILIGKRVFQEKTKIRKISKLKCIGPFIRSGVFGLGLPQVVELFLRCDLKDTFKKIGLVFSRSLVFLSIISRSNVFEIRLGRNPDKSVSSLLEFIDRQGMRG